MAEILLEAVEEIFGEVRDDIRGRWWNGWRWQGSVVESTLETRELPFRTQS
jgi:hypothetical protein